jgi:hypothetical protein
MVALRYEETPFLISFKTIFFRIFQTNRCSFVVTNNNKLLKKIIIAFVNRFIKTHFRNVKSFQNGDICETHLDITKRGMLFDFGFWISECGFLV